MIALVIYLLSLLLQAEPAGTAIEHYNQCGFDQPYAVNCEL